MCLASIPILRQQWVATRKPGLSLAKTQRSHEMPNSSSKGSALVKNMKMNIRAYETVF